MGSRDRVMGDAKIV
jgi:hypothetical protein